MWPSTSIDEVFRDKHRICTLLSLRKLSVVIGVAGPYPMLCLARRRPSLFGRRDNLLLVKFLDPFFMMAG